MRPPEPSCPGEARSRFKINKYGLKKPGDFIVSEGHEYPLSVSIISVVLSSLGGRPSHSSSFPSIPPSRPSSVPSSVRGEGRKCFGVLDMAIAGYGTGAPAATAGGGYGARGAHGAGGYGAGGGTGAEGYGAGGGPGAEGCGAGGGPGAGGCGAGGGPGASGYGTGTGGTSSIISMTFSLPKSAACKKKKEA